jgi:hypothetical protein
MHVSYIIISKLCREESAGPILSYEAILKIIYYLIVFSRHASSSPSYIGTHLTIDLEEIWDIE